jgi:hypothetical protein
MVRADVVEIGIEMSCGGISWNCGYTHSLKIGPKTRFQGKRIKKVKKKEKIFDRNYFYY